MFSNAFPSLIETQIYCENHGRDLGAPACKLVSTVRIPHIKKLVGIVLKISIFFLLKKFEKNGSQGGQPWVTLYFFFLYNIYFLSFI
jgi:hypothetical protein